MDVSGLKRLIGDRRLLIFAGCVMLFHLSNAAMLPLAAAAVTMRAGNFANLIIAACIVVPQLVVAALSPVSAVPPSASAASACCCWAGARCRCAACCWRCCRCVAPGGGASGQRCQRGGVRRADALGRLRPDTGYGAFQPVHGDPGPCGLRRSGVSTTLSGGIADTAGMQTAFFTLAGIGMAAFVTMLLTMPETRPARGAD